MEFEKLKIKTYDNWDLYLHTHQNPLIGRSYAWAKRPEAKSVIDMTPHEREELFTQVIPEWDKAVKTLYNHDLVNVSALCNNAKHLHWHLVPRHHNFKEFYREEFKDPIPHRNYAHLDKKPVSDDLLIKIRDDIASTI